jgi:type II secretory pathway predicted ATPase ExeA
MDEQTRQEIANFNYSLIAPIVCRTNLSRGEEYQLLRQIAKGQYDIPHSTRRTVSLRTLERYLKLYREGGLDFKETKEYIIHQLKLSGLSMIFPDDVVAKICSYSRGLPRIINTICTHCLIDIKVSELELVDMNVLERVIADLKL